MHKIKQQVNINIIARILIAFSLIILTYGVFLDYTNKSRLYNPITDAVEVNNNNEYTTIDINNSGNTKEEVKNNTQNNHKEEYSLEETNTQFRKQIEDTYSISIKYGKETEGYEVGGLTVTTIENPSIINASLSKLNAVLNLYPKGLFQEIHSGGIPLTVVLIERYSMGGVTGVTDSSSSRATISIATAYPFEESFFHESYHYIERYMFDKKYLSFNNWNSYNPPYFTYGEVNNEYSYASNGGKETSYFVNNYAQTADTEDRASTFEYMMDSEKVTCLNKNQNVWQKAKIISQAIEATLDCCSPDETEYWERFL